MDLDTRTQYRRLKNMSVNIQFSTGNDAFYNGNMELETIRILKDISDKITKGYLKDSIRDLNGHCIGSFEVD